MGALAQAVRAGKALYVGISSYNSQRTREATAILREMGVPLLIHQPSYSMINRWLEADGLLETLGDVGAGSIAFSPLAQGMLTSKYLVDIPATSRVSDNSSLPSSFIKPHHGADTWAKQHRCRAWSDIGADGAGLGAARAARGPDHNSINWRAIQRADPRLHCLHRKS